MKIEKYTKEYLKSNNLDDNFHSDNLEYIKSAIASCEQSTLVMYIQSLEALESFLPELIKYHFSFGEERNIGGVMLKIYLK
jgi:hypothetical protein